MFLGPVTSSSQFVKVYHCLQGCIICDLQQVACEKLVKRLQVTSKMMSFGKKPEWLDLIRSAVGNGVDLQARGHINPGPGKHGPFQYVCSHTSIPLPGTRRPSPLSMIGLF